MDIGDGEFKLLIRRKEFANNDILDGRYKVQVISEPEEIRIERRSKWWIVRAWRKLWRIKKYESTWSYKVKMVDV